MPAAVVPITARRAALLSVVWLAAALAVGLVVLVAFGTDRAVNYWSVYVLERSLSLDNIFVFLLVLDYFVIPREYRRRRSRRGAEPRCERRRRWRPRCASSTTCSTPKSTNRPTRIFSGAEHGQAENLTPCGVSRTGLVGASG